MNFLFHTSNLTHREERYHRIAQQTTVFSIALIIGLTIFFKVVEVPMLFPLGLVFLCLLLSCLWLNHQQYYLTASAIHTLGNLIFFGAGVSILGWESGLQYPLIAQAIVAQFSNQGSSSFRLVTGLVSVGAFVVLALNYVGESPNFLWSENVLEKLFFFNVLMSIFPPVIFLNSFGTTLIRAENDLESANQKNEKLVHSIFPVAIANSLKIENRGIVHRYDSVSILFADIVGFTALFEDAPPQRVVDLLNSLFSKFDDLTDKYGIEKIKTIGDAYMVAAGVPSAKANHATAIFNFAKEMLYQVEVFNEGIGTQLEIRIGISSGPVIAGVIGKKKFTYDLWGDTVNTAARMEAYGKSGRIQIAPATYELLQKEGDLQENGFTNFEKIMDLEIKGKGKMDVYLWKRDF